MNNQSRSKVLVSAYANQTFNLYTMGKVHSIFDHGFNLVFDDERLVYVNTQGDYSLSSHGISLEKEVFAKVKDTIKKDELVKVDDDFIRFYSRKGLMTVNFSDKKIVDLALKPISLNAFSAKELIDQIDQRNIFDQSGFSRDERLEEILGEILERGFLDQDMVTDLIGRGIGLTPSGDDFLQGFLMMEKALVKSTKDQSTQDLIERALENRSTTQVSMTYLDALFNNQINQFFALFLESIDQGDADNLNFFLDNIKNYGNTSGMDTMLGIQTFLKFYKDR